MQLIFLSCCRGDLPATYSRAPFSFESSAEFPWSENEIELLYKPTRIPLSIEDRNREWSRLSFPPLEVPVDCYVCFTTLPDSKLVTFFLLNCFVCTFALRAYLYLDKMQCKLNYNIEMK